MDVHNKTHFQISSTFGAGKGAVMQVGTTSPTYHKKLYITDIKGAASTAGDTILKIWCGSYATAGDELNFLVSQDVPLNQTFSVPYVFNVYSSTQNKRPVYASVIGGSSRMSYIVTGYVELN